MDCQYVATQRGGVALVFEGHRYNKVRDGKDGTVYWRCSRDRQCPGRAVTVNSRIKKANNKHNHNPDSCVKNGQTLLSSGQMQQLSQLGALSHLLHPTSAAFSAPSASCPGPTSGCTSPLNARSAYEQPHLSAMLGSCIAGSNGQPPVNLIPPSSVTPLRSVVNGNGTALRNTRPVRSPVYSTDVLDTGAPSAGALEQLLCMPGLLGDTLRVLSGLSSGGQLPLAELAYRLLGQVGTNNLVSNGRSSSLPDEPAEVDEGEEEEEEVECEKTFVSTNRVLNPAHSSQRVTDYYSDSSDEEQPLDMATRTTQPLLKKLRALMKTRNVVGCEPLHAYLVPSADAHQSEYPAPCDKRRAFISGFTGSAGLAVITSEQAALWTDGRYHEQAEQELCEDWTLMKQGLPGTPHYIDWLIANLPPAGRVGVDPQLITNQQFTEWTWRLKAGGLQLQPLPANLIDLLWTQRPTRPSSPIRPLPLSYAGVGWRDKLINVREAMKKRSAALLLLTELDEIAWLLNLRGADIEYNPVFFAYVAITPDELVLFIDDSQLTEEAKTHLQLSPSNGDALRTGSPDEPAPQLRPYDVVGEYLRWFVAHRAGQLWLPTKSNFAIVSLVPEQRRICRLSPVALAKAKKNPVELQGMKEAQLKDSVALCEFFAWLEAEVNKGDLSECSAARQLHSLRAAQGNFVQDSFETISASGPNSSIVHYRPCESHDRALSNREIYLVDSGGQYLDGTTDVTRTVHLGSPTPFEREAFTRVLKGHIALASSVFPEGVKGHCLDSLARRPLWEAGLNYLHGTGHGVGCYLNVHEGPMGIGRSPMESDPGLSEGMILSNEPGFYEQGRFGIRIESLMLVKAKETKYSFNNEKYLCFETITLVPIQTKMLEPSLLTADELDWLEQYHQLCREVVGKKLKEQGKIAAYQWLLKETQPLG